MNKHVTDTGWDEIILGGGQFKANLFSSANHEVRLALSSRKNFVG